MWLCYLNFASIDGGLFLFDVQDEFLAAFGNALSGSGRLVFVTIDREFDDGLQGASLQALLVRNTLIVSPLIFHQSNEFSLNFKMLTDGFHNFVKVFLVAFDELEFAGRFVNHFFKLGILE